MGGLAQQVELHDGKKVRRDVQQQCRQDQGQATIDDVMTVGVKLITTAGTEGFFVVGQRGPAHQQITLMAGHQLIQRQMR
ncbi:hypothetical protein D3C75_1319580 [compost metagenome]